jgi:transposase
MRGRISQQSQMFSYVDLDSRVPGTHPLRRIKELSDAALRNMDSQLTALYSPIGRESIPPEQLLKASLLQIIYGIRSERQLMEQIQFNMLYRWFLDLALDQEIWVPTVYSHNRDRLLCTDVARTFLSEIVQQATSKGFVSNEHFSVDGTLLQAWASTKGFERIDSDKGPGEPPTGTPPSNGDAPAKPIAKDLMRDFKGQTFSNKTHRSKSDPDARLARKGDFVAAKPSYLGNALMENRSGLVLDGEVRLAAYDGGETAAALSLVDRLEGDHEITLGADKGYDSEDFVARCTEMKTVTHVAQNKGPTRRSFVPDQIVATPGYAVSIRCRKRIEQVFGWIKLAGGLRQVKIRGKAAVDGLFLLALSAYNLVRLNRLMAQCA